MNSKFINISRIFLLLCIGAKVMTISAQLGNTNLSLWCTMTLTLSILILFSLGYFSVETGIRYFIWPQLLSIYRVLYFRKSMSKVKDNTADYTQTFPSSPDVIKNAKTKEVIEYLIGTFDSVLQNHEIALLVANLKALLSGHTNLEAAVEKKIKGLHSGDFYHLGWNLSTHLNIPQIKISQFLKSQFPENLKNVEVTTIPKKMADDGGKFKLKREFGDVLIPFPLAQELKAS